MADSDYYVSVRSQGRPPKWRWEIQRRSKPLGVVICGDGFSSEFAAKLAGEKALRETSPMAWIMGTSRVNGLSLRLACVED
jgi:hypothetical protein